MKRRDFLVTSSAGLAGAALPILCFGQARPCPPPNISVSGGTSANTTCSAVDADADFAARASGPGVVWAHNFLTRAEVDAFRVAGGYGNDPTDTHGSTVKFLESDGIGSGGCLEITVPTGGIANGGWWRPMSAIRAGDNGLSTADRGANGALPRRAWDPSSPQQNWNWRGGYYGHQDYHTQYATWQGQSNVWDGNEFYFQFRVKMSPDRWTGYAGPQSSDTRNPNGKLMFIDATGSTHESEIVIYSGGPDPVYFHDTYPYRMYTASGSMPNSFLSSPQGAGGGASLQAGGPYENTCRIGVTTSGANDCWEWPRAAEWVTVLVHVVPGHDNQADQGKAVSQWANKDTKLEVWVARAGQTTYTKVFNNQALAWLFGDRNGNAEPYELHPPAVNSVCPSAYMNNVPAVKGWYQRYDQLIFSKQFIPCPLV